MRHARTQTSANDPPPSTLATRHATDSDQTQPPIPPNAAEANAARTKTIAKGEPLGLKAAHAFAGTSGASIAELRAALRTRLEKDGHWGDDAKMLDGAMVGAVMPLTSDCVAQSLPSGQQKPFPANQFALMTGTGAKGGGVNFSQISVMLPPQLSSASLPSPNSTCRSRAPHATRQAPTPSPRPDDVNSGQC